MNSVLQDLEIAIVSFEETVGCGNSSFLECIVNDSNESCTQKKIDESLLHRLVNDVINYKFSEALSVKPAEVFGIEYVTEDNYAKAVNILSQKIKDYISVSTASTYIRQFNILLLGISSLQQFVKCNWTGPMQNTSNETNFLVDCLPKTENSGKTVSEMLSVNGDFIYSNAKYPELLLLSKILFSSLEDDLCVTTSWWMLRYLMIHQQILPERNVELYQKMKFYVTKILNMCWVKEKKYERAKVQLFIECGYMHLFYHEVIPAKKYFSDARDITGINMELSGAFGKRTYFQQKALAQLYLKLTRNPDFQPTTNCTFNSSTFPCDLHLQDDTLLNKVKFLDDGETVIDDLYPEEQIVLLAYCSLLQQSSASHKLLQEELMAYIDCILSQPKVWCIHVKSLIMRCKLEKNSSRRVERAMMQIQALVDAVNKETTDASCRLYMFYATTYPPKWKLEKELADLLITLGATKSALEIYQRLELWEDIVTCYQRLDRKDKAATIVKKLIEEKETPALWCLLGDVTDDPECYMKAWEISGKKNARAQRSVGLYFYKKKNFDTCIPFFKKSLEINHLQPTVWFALGFAATQVENHALAAQAYRSVVNLDPDNFEAWNNLSNSYIKTKQKVRAWRSLQEALKCNYENWMVWENFLLVCIDIGAFEDAIQAYHRLLDIKSKHADEEVLGIIVKAVANDLPDISGQPAARLKDKAFKLFGRVTSIITNSSNIWKHYASLHSSSADWASNKESTERVLQYLQKAFRCSIQQPQWEKDFSSCKTIVSDAITLTDAYLAHINMSDDNTKLQTKSSAKLMLRNIVSRIKQQLQDFEQCQIDELMILLGQLQEKLETVCNA